MAEVHAQQPVEANHAPAGTATQETAQQQAKPATPAASYLGDNLIPDAEMVYDQKRTSEYICVYNMGCIGLSGSIKTLRKEFIYHTLKVLTSRTGIVEC